MENNDNHNTLMMMMMMIRMPLSRRQLPACFDFDLGPMTFILKLDLDMVLINHCAKKKISIPSASKVTAQTHRHTNTQT